MTIPFKNFFKKAYDSIVVINDTPHRIAGGVAAGVMLGIFPGTGIIAAIVVAYIFRLNRAAAFAGSLLTNSWFSIVAFVFAIKIGAWFTGTNWQGIYDECKALIDHFAWNTIFDLNVWPILKPLLIGYAVIGLISGIIVYIIAIVVLNEYHRRKKSSPSQDSTL